MRFLLFIALIMGSVPTLSAQSTERHESALIWSIDDLELPPSYPDVSEEGLPSAHYTRLLSLMGNFRFTALPEVQVRDLFEKLKRNPKARMRSPGGACSTRRAYIQGLLKKSKITSGKLVIRCPANNGRLRLKDQVSGRRYTYINFHDANIVAVSTATGTDFRVLDVQFEPYPMTLQEYLTEIEASQKIRPVKMKGPSAGKRLCYWNISTPYLTY